MKFVMKVAHEISNNGPVVAGFPISNISRELKRAEVHVFVRGKEKYEFDKRAGKMKALFHGVCLTGVCVGNHFGKLELFFEYLDSNPKTMRHRDGKKAVPWHLLDSVAIPHVKNKKDIETL